VNFEATMAEVEEARTAVRGRGLVELGEDAALVLNPLRPVFLHKVDPCRGLVERARDRYARRRLRRVVDEVVAGQFVETLADETGRRGERLGARVGQPHLPSGPGEHDRPGPADKACAYDGDGWHVLSLSS
jgi:hypothetical protein